MKGFKTILFGILLVLTSVFSNAEVQTFVAENLPAVGSAIGTIVIVLRAITSSGIFGKENTTVDKKDE